MYDTCFALWDGNLKQECLFNVQILLTDEYGYNG